MSLATALWKRQPGDFFFISTKSATKEWRDTAFERGDWNAVEQFIRDNRDKDLYFCPHGFSRSRRVKASAVMPKMLWSDMDETDPRTCHVRPTIAIESSPKRYVGLWLVDKPVTENLNKRLTHYNGGDTSGCDVTQVLRVPGTFNYKYQSTPRVRILWDDGPTYKVSELEEMLPEVETVEREEIELPERLPALEWRDLTRPVQRALRTCERMTDRSLRLIYVARAMLREHYEPAEIASVLMMKDQLVSEHLWDQKNPRRAARRAIERALGEAKEGGTEHQLNGYNFFAQTMEGETTQEVDWLWCPYLARGEITIIQGDPGAGKSYLMQMVGKAFCDGEELPTKFHGHPRRPVQGKVFFADIENDRKHTTLPRLRWNNIKNIDNFVQEDEPFTIDDRHTMKMLHEQLEKQKPVLMVFDTVNLYIGNADINKANETTQALAVFKDIARRYNCAVVLIRHLTKSSKEKSLYRGVGSIALTAVPRIVLLCGTDPEDHERHLLMVDKMNLGPKPPALSYEVSGIHKLNSSFGHSEFHWGDWDEKITTEEIIMPTKKEKSSDRAEEVLRDRLADGGVELSRLENIMDEEKIPRATFYRVAKRIGIVKEVSGFGKDRQSIWSLPA